jgi:DNA-binding winged helix-turn-helix (wHTH) protein
MSLQPIHNPDHRLIRFGTFEADPATGELRKAGHKIRLQDQPFRILLLLLENPGEVVSPAERRMKIWGETYVDFEEGLNTAVRKLRDALGDSATNPRFIETLPRRGYRFIAPTELVGGVPAAAKAKESRRPRWLWFAGVPAVALVALILTLSIGQQPLITAEPPKQLTRDSGLTTEPAISQDGNFVVYASESGGRGQPRYLGAAHLRR